MPLPARQNVLVDLARFGAAAVAAPLLEKLAVGSESDSAPVLAAFARSLVTNRPDDLAAASHDLAGLEMYLLAAEAATAAAAGFAAVGRAGLAAEWRDRAGELVARCPGAATPGLRGAAARAALSRREHEVASLAVSGLGNRQIAERLGVSKRTIDSQLQKVYEKLAITGRPDLAAALEHTA
jgi:DNA-binding CsgD family transcriptional regulator